MWQGDGDELAVPAQSRTRKPFRTHDAPESMGQDDYIRYPSGVPSGNDDRLVADNASQRTTSTAHLRGAAMGRTSSAGHGDDDARSARSVATITHGDIDTMDLNSKAGVPIGLLAARGTPYAKKPIYLSRKCKILCPILGVVTTAVTLIITLFPVLRAVAVHTLSTSVMSVTASNITNPTDLNFGLTLEGQVHKVGIFPAQLFFNRPVDVYWIAPENLTQELHLGSFALAPIGVAAGHGRIKQQTRFNITNEPAFARFTQFLITQEAFTWRLKSIDVQAKAFSFIAVNGLSFTKDLTLPGMANMTDISITDFQLPGNDPAGGISLAVTTKLTNPSAFGVQMGTLIVALYYDGLYLGPAQTVKPFNLTSGVNEISLIGRMIDYSNNTAALNKLSVVFSNYLSGGPTPVEARGVSVLLPDGSSVAWLQAGVQALILNVPLSSPQGRISPITSILIESLSLNFNAATPYAPTANSSHTSATFGLPFGFSLDIVELSNSFAIVSNKSIVAALSAPLGSSKTTILTQNAGYTSGGIVLDLPLSPISVGTSYQERMAFEQFNYDFTTQNGSGFILIGNTTAVTNTPIGQVKLSNIGFTLPAGLIGLNSLNTYPTEIVSVDVIGGSADAVILEIVVGLTNPSNLELAVGNVTFQLFNGDSFLGTTVLPDLKLSIGYQQHLSYGYFQANNNPIALKTLTDFSSGRANQLTIKGFNGSSQTTSLNQAFMAINLKATLAGLGTKLINSANLTVTPNTGVTTNAADSVVALANPFTSNLLITNIQSNITAHGLFVGSITQAVNFPAAGKAVTVSPVLNFDLNLFPPDIFALVRALVVQSGQDPAALDGVVSLGGITYSPTTLAARMAKRDNEEEQFYADQLIAPAKSNVIPGQDSFDHMYTPEHQVAMDHAEDDSRLDAMDARFDDNSTAPVVHTLVQRALTKRAFDYTNFNLPTYIINAFKTLTVTVDLVSVLHIGEFTTDLAYSQSGVPAYTDSSLTLLLPILARPIVQKIVDASILNVDTVMITDPSNTAFNTGLVGSIRNAGPFDASILFPQGLTVAWNGAPLGQIAMPETKLVANVGADLSIQAAFQVANLNHLTEFTSFLLTEPSFTWQIYGENLQIVALGITVSNISISKNVILDGMNGFKGAVIIENFDLPANDPAGGVALTLQTSLKNPSSVGVALSTIGFVNSFGNTIIGPASSTAPFQLLPKSTIQLPLAGRLIPQTTPQGLADVSTIFNGFLHGVPSQLIVTGTNSGPADCVWLNEGIKKLSIPVILPAAVNLQVINSITINQMTLLFTPETSYNPAFSTSNTVAVFQLPFAFPVDIQQIQTTLTASDGTPLGTSAVMKRDQGDFAQLNVPLLPAKTDIVARTLLLTFSGVPFQSVDNGVFSNFLLATTQGTSKSFGLHGSANTLTSTAIGLLSLEAIAFSVETSVLGLQGLNARPATVANLDVFHGYPSYLQINADASLYNPSNITIGTGNVQFGLQFNGQILGSANIVGLTLVPGVNVIPTAVHYQPVGDVATAAGLILLENYIQGVTSDTIIVGTADTTPIDSLKAALGSIKLGTSIPALQQNLITQAALVLPLDIAETSIAGSTFILDNPFTANINLLGVIANASYEGLFLGQINVPSINPPIFAPGKTVTHAPNLPLKLNTDPKALANFLIAAAKAQGVDLGILLPQFAFLFSEASTQSTVKSMVNLQPETCTPTGTTKLVNGLILAAVKNLKTTIVTSAITKLDDFQTPLTFTQNNVPTILDETVLYLTGVLGKTLVTNIVDGATLAFTKGIVTNVTDTGFAASLTGALLNAGPFDALISFPGGVMVNWQGKHIANIDLPPVCATGGIGVPNYQTDSLLTIADLDAFTEFATYILLNPGFTWTISTTTLSVSALGTIFSNVALSKVISFTAFNGLPGVAIVNPNFPGDSGTSILLETATTIPSLSNLGIELGHVSFVASFMGEEVGPIDGFGLTLLPLATVTTNLKGTIIQRTSQASTDSLGILFSGFLAGENQTLSVTGNQVITPAQPDRPVNWLTAAFKKLTLAVVLPGKKYTIISKVALQDLTVSVLDQSQAYRPVASNNLTEAIYTNPFGFSLTAVDAGGAFTINYKGVDTALLTLPVAPVLFAETSTGNAAALKLNFKNQPLVSLNTGSFNDFFSAITNDPSATFGLHGTTNVTAKTVVGNVVITGIPFDVQTSFPGLNGFNHQAVVPATPIVTGSGGGDPFGNTAGSDFIRITLAVVLNNPAPLILFTNFVRFEVLYGPTKALVGYAYINPLNLYPGQNTVQSEFHYAPPNPADANAQAILTAYLSTTGAVPITVQGDVLSSPYGSLQEGLSKVTLETSFPGQGKPLISDIVIYFDPIQAICKNSVKIETRIFNNLQTPISILSLAGTTSQGGKVVADFNTKLSSPLVAQPGGQVSDYSVMIDNINLTQGPTASGGLLFTTSQGLDVDIVSSALVGSYFVPGLSYKQKGVPYRIVPTLNGQSLNTPNPPPGLEGLASLTGLAAAFSQLSASTICGPNGILTLKPGQNPATALNQVPGALVSAIQGVAAAITAVPGLSAVAAPISQAATVVGGILGGILGTPAASPAAGAGSPATAAGAGGSAAPAAATGGVLGGAVVPGVIKRDTYEAYEAMKEFLAFDHADEE